VIGARFVGEAEVGAEEGRPKLRDEFFMGVRLVAEPSEGSIQTVGGAAPVDQFVQQGPRCARRTLAPAARG
jgi:hypothetical protein